MSKIKLLIFLKVMSSKKIKKIEKKREDIRRYLYCNYPIYHLQIPLKANPQSLLKTLGLLKHWIFGQPGRNVQSHSLNIIHTFITVSNGGRM